MTRYAEAEDLQDWDVQGDETSDEHLLDVLSDPPFASFGEDREIDRHRASLGHSSSPPHLRTNVWKSMDLLEVTDDSAPAMPSPPVSSKPTGPIQLLDKILKTWQLDEVDAIPLLGLEPSDQGYVVDVLAGRKALRGRDAKDRLACLIQMRMTLFAWFKNEAVENEWLREPQEPLDGKVPMELLLEGSMENLLLVKEYIEAATGW